MPEGKLRSGVYRSFIMCDDPRDVVECVSIKKQSKSRNITNTKQSSSKAKERSEPSRKSTEDAPHSSLQLLRVSEGIQKLNVAIDSWSKGISFESASRPEDIAKSLLRGALDLEESLAMLSSIQEDDIEKKPRNSKDGRRSDSRFQRSMSERSGERIEKRTMVQENVEAESKDCYDELRKVIRESFLRQNLLLQTISGTKNRVVRSEFVSSSGAASSSTSSSQSSMVSGSTKSSASSDIPRKAPSLIARLMGLDVSTQEPGKTTVNRIEKPDVVSSERREHLRKTKNESPEFVRCNSSREAALPSLPKENQSNIVLVRPMRAVQSEIEVKPGNKRPVLAKKLKMQGEVHPKMINERKDNHQATEINKRISNKMKLPPPSLTKKEREQKEWLRKVQENNEVKVIKLMNPSNVKAVTKDRIPIETNKKLVVKKEISEGKDRSRPHDRALTPPNTPSDHKKSKKSSDNSKTRIRRSGRLSSSSSSSEQKRTCREKKSGEANKPNAKKKHRQQDNDLGSENNSGSSQDTHGSISQLVSEETTSSEFNTHQGHCDNEEVSSSDAKVQHSHEPESSQIDLRSFLSSSSEFISYAEYLFDFNPNTNTKRSRESAFQDKYNIMISDQRLALDFAKEVARRRSLTRLQRSSLHIDELLMEVCDEFESLRSYKDTFSGQNNFVQESIHLVLEKDLKDRKTEMRSGVWDLGWRSEFRIDETHRTVVELEKLIMSGLIQEIIT